MRKRAFLSLLVLMLVLLFSACGAKEEAISYDTEHEHIYGFWYEAESADCTKEREQVRYCKICHEPQTKALSPAAEHAFTDTVVPPNGTEAGYVERHCARCGHTERLGFER